MKSKFFLILFLFFNCCCLKADYETVKLGVIFGSGAIVYTFYKSLINSLKCESLSRDILENDIVSTNVSRKINEISENCLSASSNSGVGIFIAGVFLICILIKYVPDILLTRQIAVRRNNNDNQNNNNPGINL